MGNRNRSIFFFGLRPESSDLKSATFSVLSSRYFFNFSNEKCLFFGLTFHKMPKTSFFYTHFYHLNAFISVLKCTLLRSLHLLLLEGEEMRCVRSCCNWMSFLRKSKWICQFEILYFSTDNRPKAE